MSKICRRLKVIPKEQVNAGLAHELNIIHEQIQACVFQKGFKDLISYILPDENKINFNKVVLRKIATFETIQRIMNPKIPSLKNIFESKWAEIRKEHEGADLGKFEVSYFGKK